MCHEVCPRVTSGRYQISLREDFFEDYYYAKGSSEGQDGVVVTTFLKDLIDKGKIAGFGTHEELLKSNKIYQNLYHTESLNS